MIKKEFDYSFVLKQIQKKDFGILGTTDLQNRPHSTGILFGTTPRGSPLALYFLTGKAYKKTRNIAHNPFVSFAIPYPHYYLRFVPSSCITMKGRAEILDFSDSEARRVFRTKRILRMTLDGVVEDEGDVFIKMVPEGKIYCYGIGYSVLEMRKNLEAASYSVKIP